VASNFDVEDIVAVAPQCDIKDEQARMYGKGPARDYLLNIKESDNLAKTLEDCTYAVAITRRVGPLSPEEIPLIDLSTFLAEKGSEKIAFVFGREDNCLTREETLLCTHFTQIPTSPVMPTMNLSHAVATILSRVYVDLIQKEKTKIRGCDGRESIAPISGLEELFEHWQQTMLDINLTTNGNPERMLKFIRRIIHRSAPSEHEVSVLRGFLSKTQLAMGTKKKRKQRENPKSQAPNNKQISNPNTKIPNGTV